MAAQLAGLVPHPPTDRRVGRRNGVDDRSNGDRRREVDLDGGGAAGVGAQRRGQPDDDLQRTTAVFTQTTGGRYWAAVCQCSPPSGEANTSPVRVPT